MNFGEVLRFLKTSTYKNTFTTYAAGAIYLQTMILIYGRGAQPKVSCMRESLGAAVFLVFILVGVPIPSVWGCVSKSEFKR